MSATQYQQQPAITASPASSLAISLLIAKPASMHQTATSSFSVTKSKSIIQLCQPSMVRLLLAVQVTGRVAYPVWLPSAIHRLLQIRLKHQELFWGPMPCLLVRRSGCLIQITSPLLQQRQLAAHCQTIPPACQALTLILSIFKVQSAMARMSPLRQRAPSYSRVL